MLTEEEMIPRLAGERGNPGSELYHNQNEEVYEKIRNYDPEIAVGRITESMRKEEDHKTKMMYPDAIYMPRQLLKKMKKIERI